MRRGTRPGVGGEGGRWDGEGEGKAEGGGAVWDVREARAYGE